MARGRGLLLAGLAAGAYTYFKKPENREKATAAFNNAKAKYNSYLESQNLNNSGDQTDSSSAEKAANNETTASTEPTVQYVNETQEDEKKTKLSPNDTNQEKSENTASVAPETRINTENL